MAQPTHRADQIEQEIAHFQSRIPCASRTHCLRLVALDTIISRLQLTRHRAQRLVDRILSLNFSMPLSPELQLSSLRPELEKSHAGDGKYTHEVRKDILCSIAANELLLLKDLNILQLCSLESAVNKPLNVKHESSTAAHAAHTAAGREGCAGSATLTPEAIKAMSPNDIADLATHRADIATADCVLAVSELAFSGRTWKKDWQRETLSQTFAKSAYFQAHPAHRDKIIDALVAMRAEAESAAGGATPPATPPQASRTLPPVPSTAAHAAHTAAGREGCAGSATLTPEAIKAMSPNDIADLATQRADIATADCVLAVSELAFSGRTWKKDWQRETLSQTFAKSAYFQAHPAHRDKIIDALVAMRAEAESAAGGATPPATPPQASRTLPPVPSTAAHAAHTAAGREGCAGSATLTPEAIKAMSPNDIADLATQRADIATADCIRAVSELAFSGRTWKKDWQRETLSQTFAKSAYFQAHPAHRDKIIDALVAMRAEAESAAGGATPPATPPQASRTLPPVPSTAAHAAHTAAGREGCAGSATLTPEAIKAMSPNDIADLATHRADIATADCIRAVSELAFSGRTWKKDWQRETLSQTFAKSAYFQAHPAHRDKIIDALVAMRAEAESAAGGATPPATPPQASRTLPPVPSTAAHAAHTAAGREGCAGSATLTPEAIKAMSPNDIADLATHRADIATADCIRAVSELAFSGRTWKKDWQRETLSQTFAKSAYFQAHPAHRDKIIDALVAMRAEAESAAGGATPPATPPQASRTLPPVPSTAAHAAHTAAGREGCAGSATLTPEAIKAMSPNDIADLATHRADIATADCVLAVSELAFSGRTWKKDWQRETLSQTFAKSAYFQAHPAHRDKIIDALVAMRAEAESAAGGATPPATPPQASRTLPPVPSTAAHAAHTAAGREGCAGSATLTPEAIKAMSPNDIADLATHRADIATADCVLAVSELAFSGRTWKKDWQRETLSQTFAKSAYFQAHPAHRDKIIDALVAMRAEAESAAGGATPPATPPQASRTLPPVPSTAAHAAHTATGREGCAGSATLTPEAIKAMSPNDIADLATQRADIATADCIRAVSELAFSGRTWKKDWQRETLSQTFAKSAYFQAHPAHRDKIIDALVAMRAEAESAAGGATPPATPPQASRTLPPVPSTAAHAAHTAAGREGCAGSATLTPEAIKAMSPNDIADLATQRADIATADCVLAVSELAFSGRTWKKDWQRETLSQTFAKSAYFQAHPAHRDKIIDALVAMRAEAESAAGGATPPATPPQASRTLPPVPSTAAHAAHTAAGREGCAGSATLTPEAIKAMSPNDIADLATQRADIATADCIRAVSELAFSGRTWKKDWQRETLSQTFAKSAYFQAHPAHRDKIIDALVAMRAEAESAAGGATPPATPPQASRTLPPVPSTAAHAAHTAAGREGCAGSATLTPEAIKAMSPNDIADLATQRADIATADCIRAVSELAFSGRTWKKDWQRETLSQTFAKSAYFQAHPAHRDKIIDALVAMRAEAESAAGGATPPATPPQASRTLPPVPSTAAHAAHTAAGREGCAGSATLTPEAIKAMSPNDIADLATQRADIATADCIRAVSELAFSGRTWKKDWQRETLSQTFAKSAYFQAHPAHRDKIIDALVAMRAEAESAAGGATPPATPPQASRTLPPVPSTAAHAAHTAAGREGCAGSATLTPEAIKAMSPNDIADLATQRADIATADCIRAVSELAFSGRTWKKDWQRETLSQTFAKSAYFQAHPAHRDKIIDALVAMRAEAESAAGGATPPATPPQASRTLPPVPSTAAHAAHTAAGREGCAGSATLTPEAIKAMSPNDIADLATQRAGIFSEKCSSALQKVLKSLCFEKWSRDSLQPALEGIPFFQLHPVHVDSIVKALVGMRAEAESACPKQ
jgi:predicted RNase H-like nuclease